MNSCSSTHTKLSSVITLYAITDDFMQLNSPQPLIVINTKNCSLSIVLTATDQKPQKSLKR